MFRLQGCLHFGTYIQLICGTIIQVNFFLSHLHLGEALIILLININSFVTDVIPARSYQPYCLAICVLFDRILNILSQILNDQGVTYIPVHQYTIQNHICELRDLRGKSGLFRDHIWTLVLIGTKSRNRDFSASTASFKNTGIL